MSQPGGDRPSALTLDDYIRAGSPEELNSNHRTPRITPSAIAMRCISS